MSKTEVNLGFLSGTISSHMDHRDWDGGKSVEFAVRHFVRKYTDRDGGERVIEHEFKFSCKTSTKYPNPVYDEVRQLLPGDWVHLRYSADQVQYEKNGEPRTWDKRVVTQVIAVLKSSEPQAPAPVEQAVDGGESDLPF